MRRRIVVDVIMKGLAGHLERELPASLNDFFPHKVCINLDRRPDRWQRMQARFAEHNIGEVTRFSALDGATLISPPHWDDFPGAYGCLRSHMAVVEQARKLGMPSVLIFEDDVVFDPEINARFADHIRQVPSDWDMIYFGGIHGAPPIRVTDGVVRITHSLSTYAYALRETVYDGFLELNEKALTVLDENTRELQKYFNCYCFMPHLAWVEVDHSDVRGETEILWWIKESLVLWGDEMDRILRSTVVVMSHQNSGQNAGRTLNFIVNYYSRWLPDVVLLIVEQGESPSVDVTALPPQCRYEFVYNAGEPDRNRAFNLGFEMFESSKEFFVFADSDIFLVREDFKANLMKCSRHDFASAFCNLWVLPEEETSRILNNEIRWNAASYHLKEKTDIRESCCMITRTAMRAVRLWEERENVSAQINQSLRVFQSPNRARRLFNG